MHISIITKTETETAEQYVVCGDQLYYTLMHMIVLCRIKKQYRCEQCGINFDSLEEFTRHDKEKHVE